ncbi:MAG: hypothetical protein Q8L40_01625, partial [Burkholderiales bacterium]|nr:hypothetical protein [Burkholderiales bacterium]
AVFYGIGVRLDEQPELLFTLRRVDAKDLVARAGADLPLAKKGPVAGKVLDDAKLAGIFGIEIVETTVTDTRVKAAATRKKPPASKKPLANKKPPASKKPPTGKKPLMRRKKAAPGKRKAA